MLVFLTSKIPPSLFLQGPFQGGVVSSFIDYVRTLPAEADVYLCGWDSGFSKVFSILECLNEISDFTNIRSINCIFNHIPDHDVRERVHVFLNRLIRDWKSDVSVTILQVEEKDLRSVEAMSDHPPFSTKEEAMNYWKGISSTLPLTSNSSTFRPIPNRSRWIIMKKSHTIPATPTSPNENRIPLEFLLQKILYFCGQNFQPKLFQTWKYFVETP